MPLFKVTRSLNHDLVTYEPNTIHEFKDPDTISHLVDIGVLIEIPLQKEKDLKDTSLKLDDKPLNKIQEETKTLPPENKVICSKCGVRVDILPKETIFYKTNKNVSSIKQMTCAKCGNKITKAASAEEKKKIEGGLIHLTKI